MNKDLPKDFIFSSLPVKFVGSSESIPISLSLNQEEFHYLYLLPGDLSKPGDEIAINNQNTGEKTWRKTNNSFIVYKNLEIRRLNPKYKILKIGESTQIGDEILLESWIKVQAKFQVEARHKPIRRLID